MMHPGELRAALASDAAFEALLARHGFVGDAGSIRRSAREAASAAALDDARAARLVHAALALPDPAGVLLRFGRIAEAQPSPAPLVALVDGAGLAPLLRIVAGSESLSSALARHPGMLAVLEDEPVPPGRDALLDAMRAEVFPRGEAFDQERATRRLVRARQRELLRVAWLDFGHGMEVIAVTRALSRLADASLAVALDVARASLERRGDPPPADGAFAVIALGKLGGEELNYSSDVDLLFVWSDGGGDAGARYDALARLLVHVLGARTDEGHLFRVDLRLRPEGFTGPITRSIDSYEAYYRDFGRPWERQMLLKARAAAGDRRLGAAFLERVRPFVAETFLDVRAIAEMKRLRLAMERGGRGPTIDVKTGSGGIRDVEYSVQFLQLFHGLARPDVLQANTVEAIAALSRAGVLSPEEASFLDGAYRYLRRAENHLQVFADVQTHRLPQDPARLRSMGTLLGFRGEDAGARLVESLGGVMARVREFYQRKLGMLFDVTSGNREDVFNLMLRVAPSASEVKRVLGGCGFERPEAAYRLLVRLVEGSSRFLRSSPRHRDLVLNVIPDLLQEAAASSEPDLALENFERIVRGLGSREVFFRLLGENRRVLSLFVALAGGSQSLSDLLAREPAILDAFVDALLVGEAGARARRRTLATLGRTAGDTLVLHDVKALELLRIGARDLERLSSIHRTVLDLARLAVALLRAAFDVAWRAAERAHGPMPAARMAVIALGNLGAMEMNYASDVDLMFVYDDAQADEPSTEVQAFCQDVAARVARILSEPTDRGVLYRIDLRLRPEGEHGPVATSFRSLRDYYVSGRARLFEHQSVLRARPVAGDRPLGLALRAFLHERIRNHPFQATLAAEMLAMRQRLETTSSKLDVKRGPGGLVDIEFVIQFLVLRHAARAPEIVAAKTMRALRLLRAARLLDDAAMDALAAAYEAFRTLENTLQIRAGLDRKEVPADESARDRLAVRMGYLAGSGTSPGALLLADVERHRARVRDVFTAVLAER